MAKYDYIVFPDDLIIDDLPVDSQRILRSSSRVTDSRRRVSGRMSAGLPLQAERGLNSRTAVTPTCRPNTRATLPNVDRYGCFFSLALSYRLSVWWTFIGSADFMSGVHQRKASCLDARLDECYVGPLASLS